MLHDSDRLCFDVLSQLLWKMEENVLLYVRRILLKHLSRCFSISSDAMNLEQRGQWKPEGGRHKDQSVSIQTRYRSTVVVDVGAADLRRDLAPA